jgi:hypothetical protein
MIQTGAGHKLISSNATALACIDLLDPVATIELSLMNLPLSCCSLLPLASVLTFQRAYRQQYCFHLLLALQHSVCYFNRAWIVLSGNSSF